MQSIKIMTYKMLDYEILQKKIKTFLLSGILFELKKKFDLYIFSLLIPSFPLLLSLHLSTGTQTCT